MTEQDIAAQARGRIRAGFVRVRDALAFLDGQFTEAADELEIMGWPGRSRQLLSELPEPLGRLMSLSKDLITELEPKR
ncbi:hypothetical protein NLX83_39455 [Allokutzneria sp. A3M-2-11 16]|uniref:hypothetical protein n=1 Tax=Allokutzneria sp. A3M-2-11 16 TaxID=2962043 RepID=UPI0020B7F637|nr:hypothetical protein [Allokutzneria sp. A3M-2-11 16]MCP3805361.1 hypothetical protein [Allokutzneria sp. A3M-2-11 16]